MSVIADEERSFNRTLDLGVRHIKKVFAHMEANGSHVVPGKDAQLLFASMGFPIDLTKLMAEERGFSVDEEEFKSLMEEERDLSKAANAKGERSKDLSLEAEQTAWLQRSDVTITDSSAKYKWDIDLDAQIVACFHGRGLETAGFEDSASVDHGVVGLILDKSSFYYESGGQIYDTGVIAFANGDVFTVSNVQTYAGYSVHVGTMSSGTANVGDKVICKVDYLRRGLIAPNHTMTHVLNFAIRKTLLNDTRETVVSTCDQKGSLVDEDKLRFDFSWNAPLTPDEVKSVEGIVVEKIRSEIQVYAQVVPLSVASKIHSLRMVFGEKYPDPVRVISVGENVDNLINNPDNTEWAGLSVEFCGGTHLNNTKEAADFVLVEESGIAKGIRRIVGLTKNAAIMARENAHALLSRLTEMEKSRGNKDLQSAWKIIKQEVDQAVVSLVDKHVMRSKLDKIMDVLKAWTKEETTRKSSEAVAQAEVIATACKEKAVSIIVGAFEFGSDGKIAKKIYEKMKSIYDTSTIIISLDEAEDKVAVNVYLTKDHVSNGLNAKVITDKIMTLGEGRGGGKDMQSTCTLNGNRELHTKVVNMANSIST